MTARSTLALSALALLGFAVAAGVRYLNVSDSSFTSQAIAADAQHRPSAAPAPAPVARSEAVAHPALPEESARAEQVGQAQGNIHFERQPGEKETQGVSIDFEVKAALGLWQPGESRMRILLLESEPKRDQVAQLIDTIQSGEAGNVGGRALIELKFIPNAQTFDRNDLDSATLIASDGGLSSTADALNGLEWAGSLPSPQLELPPGSDHPTIELISSGANVHSDRATWRQSWRLSLAVPVVMRN
jgi:hypothetical protein